jgi:hypothetical protein
MKKMKTKAKLKNLLDKVLNQKYYLILNKQKL